MFHGTARGYIHDHKERTQKLRWVLTMKKLLGFLCCLGSLSAYAQTTFGPAPTGSPHQVALRVIREAEHPCPKVVSAKRDASGAIRAYCSNGEQYLIASMSNPKHGTAVMALRCSAAKALLKIDC